MVTQSIKLTEFWKKCSDQANPGFVARLCANLKKESEKSEGPSLKKSCPAHLKIGNSSKKVKKFITSNFAENADFDQFLGPNFISEVYW